MDLNSPKTLSQRGQYIHSVDEILIQTLNTTLKNKYDPSCNPQGIVNMGSATNKLMMEEIKKQIFDKDSLKYEAAEHQFYYTLSGKPSVCRTVAGFLNTYFDVTEDVDPEEIVIMAGAGSCLDSLASALFDPNDIFITPCPMYGRIYANFNQRSLAQPILLEVPEKPDSDGNTFMLTSSLVEDKILELRKEGKQPKGIVLINPHNPLGDVYSPQLIRSILEICSKYEMHVIADETYALSIHDPEAKHSSVLGLANIPDPSRTHFVWAMSKDLALPGFRFGVIHSKNSALMKVLKSLAIFCPTASIIQDAGATLLGDKKWLDEIYIHQNRQRLRERYEIVSNRLRQFGIPVRSSQAGFFLWINLKQFLPASTQEAEMELFHELLKAGLYVNPGTTFYLQTPGWFRLIFSISSSDLDVGMNRLESVLRKRKINSTKL